MIGSAIGLGGSPLTAIPANRGARHTLVKEVSASGPERESRDGAVAGPGQTAHKAGILAGFMNSPSKPQSSSKPIEASDAGAPSAPSDKRKQSLYFPESMLEEINEEAVRLDRSLSWIVQRAWKTARPDIRKIPSSRGVDEAEPSDPAGSGPAR